MPSHRERFKKNADQAHLIILRVFIMEMQVAEAFMTLIARSGLTLKGAARSLLQF